MIGWGFPPKIEGGMDIHCYEISKRLVELGHDVNLILPNFNSPPYKNVEGINIFPIECEKNFSSIFYLVKTIEDYNKKIFNSFKDFNFDIIHSHDWISVLASLQLKQITKKPWVLNLHSLEYIRAAGNIFGENEIEKIEILGMENCDKILTVSNLMKRILVENYKINPKKIEVIYNAASFSSENARPENVREKYNLENEPIIFFLGRLTEQKGIEYLIYAAKKILKKFPDTKILISGQGYLLESLKKFSRILGIEDSIIFTGFLPPEELKDYYSAADVFVSPSIYEPFGITILEAMECETPVIVTENTGVAENFNHLKHLIKVKPRNSDELAKSVITLLKNKSLKKKIGKSGKEFSRKIYSWDKITKNIIKIYEEVKKA